MNKPLSNLTENSEKVTSTQFYYVAFIDWLLFYVILLVDYVAITGWRNQR